MSRFIKKKKEEIGLSPYALVFRGLKKTEKVWLNAFDYNADTFREFEVKTPEQLVELKSSKSTSWLNVYGLDNVKLMESISAAFSIDSLILSDVMNPTTRPKVQILDSSIYLNIRMIVQDKSVLSMDNLSIIISNNILISFQEQKGNFFEPIRDRIRKPTNKIRKTGTDYLAFALLDVVVDHYIFVIGELGEEIENLEEQMSNQPGKDFMERINHFKRELNFIRKVIKPAKEMILGLAKLETEFIKDENRIHFKELIDNINEANDLADSYREMIYDMMNIYHTTMSTKLNEIMRVLTIISVIFIPITFIAGVYGTNFDFLPELHWKWSYFAMLGVMALTVLGMIWYFKRKKWF
jgi:magnesium transporter